MNEQDNKSLLSKYVTELEEDLALDLVQKRINQGEDPLLIIEEAQEGMRGVGSLYENQKYFISGLMMAGEIFREIMELVEPVLVKQIKGSEVGHILLGTVQGDIHDIGKNIFSIMLRCYGFSVSDLGEDVSPSKFVEKTLELKPDVIALSGLITSSYDSMRETVGLIRGIEDKRLSKLPIIIGGGLINETVCNFVGADYWSIDAVRGVELCKEILR